MGKLTLYTKQLDMVMFNDAIVEWSTEEFFKEHIGRELMENWPDLPVIDKGRQPSKDLKKIPEFVSV